MRHHIGHVSLALFTAVTLSFSQSPNMMPGGPGDRVQSPPPAGGAIRRTGIGNIDKSLLRSSIIPAVAFPDAVPADDGGIDIATARAAALNRAHRLWGGNPTVESVVPVFDAAGKLVAYDVDLALRPGPWSYAQVATEWQAALREDDAKKHYTSHMKEDEKIVTPSHRFANVTISANFDAYPVRQAGRCVSNFYASAWVAQHVAAEALNSSSPSLVAVHMLGPWERAYRFEANGKQILVEGQEPWGWYEYDTYLTASKTAMAARRNDVHAMISAQGQLPQATIDRIRSDNRTALTEVLSESNAPLAPQFIPGYNTIFEPLEWHYGCSPTAAAMVLNYWDNGGQYGLLNGGFFTERDTVEHDTDCHVATLQYDLKVDFHTDAEGGTPAMDIYPGMVLCANNRGYQFGGGVHWGGSIVLGTANWHWEDIRSEILAGYPFVFSTSSFEGTGVAHSVAAVGYDGSLRDVIVYSTWSTNGSSLYYVHTELGLYDWTRGDAPRPGGGGSHDVKLISPDGYQGFGSCGSTGTFKSDTPTTITWDNGGSPADHVDLYYSTDGGNHDHFIGRTPDDGSYVWSTSGVGTAEARIRILQYDASNHLLSADGSYGDFTILPLLLMYHSVGGTVLPATGWHTPGESVELSATPDSGYYFVGWTGTLNGSYTGPDNPAHVTMNTTISEHATFAPLPRITFAVNMKAQFKDGSFRPDLGDIVTIRGSFNDWGNSTNNEDTLKDADNDSIYTRQFSFSPATALEYKFWKTPRGGTMGYEEGIVNRKLTVGFADTIPHIACFNGECLSVRVTFLLDMRTQRKDGTFRPDLGDVVTIRGSFNDWGNTTNNPDTLVGDAHDSVFVTTLSLAPHTMYDYKFWKTPRGGAMGYEEGIPNRQIDFGAHDEELPRVYFNNDLVPTLHLRVKAFLQGPYAGDHTMKRSLNTGGALAAHFGVGTFPGNAVDSITVEIRNAAVGKEATMRRWAPAWLLADGSIRAFADTARTTVDWDSVSWGQYYIVLRHRNHLAAMSRIPYACDGTIAPAPYDFTLSLEQYYTGDACLLVGGLYGLWSGDADGTGDVAASDRTATWNSRNQAGYMNADVDLTGDVGAVDRGVTWNNRNRATHVP